MTVPSNPAGDDDPFAHLYRPLAGPPGAGDGSGSESGGGPGEADPASTAQMAATTAQPTIDARPGAGRRAQRANRAGGAVATSGHPAGPPTAAPPATPAGPAATAGTDGRRPAGPRGGGMDRRFTTVAIGAAGGALMLAALIIALTDSGGERRLEAAGTPPATGPQAGQPVGGASPAAPSPSASTAPPAEPPVGPIETTAERLELGGEAELDTDHEGYTGAGFVAGLEEQGSSATWTVQVAKPGRYRLSVRYANGVGKDLRRTERKIGLLVNGSPAGQLRMPTTKNWDSWGDTWRMVRLKAGSNRIAVSCRSEDSCHVNIDGLRLEG
jgi:hypothetical protein